MEIGRVDYFHETSGYGFIETDAVDNDVFFHMAEVGDKDPKEGDCVEFDWVYTDEGPRATEFRLLEGDNLIARSSSNRNVSGAVQFNKLWTDVTTPRLGFEPTRADWTRENIIARGGSATVYKATIKTDEGTLEVAVKTLPSLDHGNTVDFSHISEFASEAKNWSRIDDHSHIVTLHGYGGEPAPWILMELMSGGTIAERAPLELEYAIRVIDAVAAGVQHAHDVGIFHGDLKPANVLFTEPGVEGVPKIGDWGLARALVDATTSTRGKYTIQYAPPELINGEDMTALKRKKRDIYQLGALSYEALTGRPPYQGDSPAELFGLILSGDSDPPSDICSRVPQALDTVIMKALKTDPKERYPSIRAFRQQLQNPE